MPDFVTYYDASAPNWLILGAIAISTTLAVLAIAAAIWHGMKR